jgi:hypothetical protein
MLSYLQAKVYIFARVFTNLTPFIPLSFKGEGKRFIERGFTPLLPILPLPLLREGGQGDRLQTLSICQAFLNKDKISTMVYYYTGSSPFVIGKSTGGCEAEPKQTQSEIPRLCSEQAPQSQED